MYSIEYNDSDRKDFSWEEMHDFHKNIKQKCYLSTKSAY